ncbi:MAG: ATP-binding protein [Treponema sp.]|nr:ATP-binding protein [Treponema sp.]
MIEIIKSNNELCTGCNRCVRECPMETANVTYQDEDGKIKVKVDHARCIACGRCITACKHDARYFIDDTERFFDDLSKGISISVIAAPSIRTNIPEYKNIFTYLKNAGVNLIYDTSLGADICVWAHIKYIEKQQAENGHTPIISQPCPAIVSYCEMYRHDLIPRLSPVHSPMACISIYMKKYKGINGNIAALSPCIAKKREFENTKLADYSITFTNLMEYLKKNNIAIPDKETQFDHDECGLGSLFPMPGGLRENIEYFTGKKLYIAKGDGPEIYEKLDKYAETAPEFLPDLYDVLNCTEGCNLGSAYSHNRNIFEIDKSMNDKRKRTTEANKMKHYQSIYNSYEETLDFRLFLREYRPVLTEYPKINEEDINRAFELLGKTTYEMQNIDCGACGSKTCRRMARKIALGVNIPVNCMVKSLEDVRTEQENYQNTHMQLTELEKSHEADELIRIMLDVNPHINILFDSNFHLLDCNPASVRFMGASSKEDMLDGFIDNITRSIPEFQPDGRKSASIKDKLLIAAREGSVRFETSVNIGGSLRNLDVEFKKVPYRNSFFIVGFVYDMTAMYAREKELVHAQEKNELQLTKLNAVVNATKIGLWDVTIFNNDPVNLQNVFTWSDEFRYILGYANEMEFPNTFDSWNDRLHPDEREDAHKAITEHLLDKTGKTPYDVEFRMLCKNGEYKYVRACGEAVRDKNGNAIRVAGAVMDISESKKILLDTEKQRMEAEEASKAKTVFLSNMSHEIRTPLNAIIGMTTIGKMSSDIGRKDDAFHKIEGASRHLLGVINDILDMSKIEANKLELSSISFDFEEMLQKAADIVNPRIEEKRQKFIINTGKGIPQVLIGDDQRLTQVITNLLSNAVKFTPDEGSICLDSRLMSEKNSVCRLEISVSDSGIGITEKQKKYLFDSFEQADARTSRNFGGTGLGLSISKRIVELMDGDIKVESEPGKGSKFTVSVLLKRGTSIENKSINKNFINENGCTVDFSGKTVLLAEDIEINREIITVLLEPTHLTVENAENGEAAVRMYSESPEKYSLIFMDIQMPKMDGYEATRAIRAIEAVKQKALAEINIDSDAAGSADNSRGQIPIIAMTANVFREDVEKCFKVGMNGHLRKPIDFFEMIDVLIKFI